MSRKKKLTSFPLYMVNAGVIATYMLNKVHLWIILIRKDIYFHVRNMWNLINNLSTDVFDWLSIMINKYKTMSFVVEKNIKSYNKKHYDYITCDIILNSRNGSLFFFFFWQFILSNNYIIYFELFIFINIWKITQSSKLY